MAMIEQKGPTMTYSLFLVCSSQTTPETGRERSVRDGSVRALRMEIMDTKVV